MLKQTLRLWQYKHFDSPRLILRVNPHTKANTSTRSVRLLLVGVIHLEVILLGHLTYKEVRVFGAGVDDPLRRVYR
jgi:hypothetical protein